MNCMKTQDRVQYEIFLKHGVVVEMTNLLALDLIIFRQFPYGLYFVSRVLQSTRQERQ